MAMTNNIISVDSTKAIALFKNENNSIKEKNKKPMNVWKLLKNARNQQSLFKKTHRNPENCILVINY